MFSMSRVKVQAMNLKMMVPLSWMPWTCEKRSGDRAELSAAAFVPHALDRSVQCVPYVPTLSQSLQLKALISHPFHPTVNKDADTA